MNNNGIPAKIGDLISYNEVEDDGKSKSPEMILLVVDHNRDNSFSIMVITNLIPLYDDMKPGHIENQWHLPVYDDSRFLWKVIK